MGIPGAANPLLAVGAGDVASVGERSVRLNDSDSAYFTRTPSSAGNRKTWTISFWLKNCNTVSDQGILGAWLDANNRDNVYFGGLGAVQQFFLNMKTSGSWHVDKSTNRQWRDPSAWQHILIRWNTPDGTASERAKVYLNGELVTWGGGYGVTDPGQNDDSIWNAACAHYIGAQPNNDGSLQSTYLNGYIAHFTFVDGIAYMPTEFTQTDGTTGQFVHKEYTGSYGTNGFYLNFEDNSAATSAGIGKDSSGNGNDWTPTNISVTAGVGDDSVRDSPTNGDTADETGAGGLVPSNYATWNPLDNPGNTYKNGNLDCTIPGSTDDPAVGTIGVSSGKWYFELIYTGGTDGVCVGVTTDSNIATFPGADNNSWAFLSYSGNKNHNGTQVSYGTGFTPTGGSGHGTVVGVALDVDNRKIWWSVDGTWQASGNPATGANAAYTDLDENVTYFITCGIDSSGGNTCDFSLNAGQRAFTDTAPSGFKPWATTFFPDPAIAKPNLHFDVVTYTGAGSSNQSIGVYSFQPDFLWFKNRSGQTDHHHLHDALRGTNKTLYSNSNIAEVTGTQFLTSFDANGFTLPAISSGGSNNMTNWEMVNWAWKAATTASGTWGTNSKAYSRRTNATAGFSIIKYVGDASTGIPGTGAIPHGLSGAPDLLIQKRLDNSGNWWSGFNCFDGTWDYLKLDDNTGKGDESYALWDADEISNWGAPDGSDFIAYVFKSIPGYSKIGSYAGTGVEKRFVWTGFRPRWVMVKGIDFSGESWFLWDTERDPYNEVDDRLLANEELMQNEDQDFGDILSNGFCLYSTWNGLNGSSKNYLYYAVAESPFKYSRAR